MHSRACPVLVGRAGHKNLSATSFGPLGNVLEQKISYYDGMLSIIRLLCQCKGGTS